ncbi:hypothetical protein J5N97_014645 [Dioscorea zingiberensis]|uniref:Bromo domain-containing protein n=1 Tax=Dioscorea zingiberensis TaxID=325984 RepID=A0A9D5HJX1_9LILI|nr:hypothetical protein J5N97_014645 [Dioscorea zingiberensis]
MQALWLRWWQSEKIRGTAGRAYQASNYQAFTNPDMSSQIPPFSNWSDNIQFGANPTSISLTTASNLPASSASLPQSNRYAAIFESSTSLGHGTNFEDFNSVQGLSCELHTDELLDLFTKIGTPEFLQSNISNTETSSGVASETVLGVNSQLLYGQGSQAIYPSYASFVTAGSTTQKNMRSELKQPEFLQTSIFNMPPNSSQTLDDHFGIDTRLLSGKGMQPMDGYFGVTSQLHSGEGMQALYPSYASSVAPGLMMQINRSSELKQPEFFQGSVFNTTPSSREALLGGNSQLLTGKGKEVAYPSNANSPFTGIMAQSKSFESKQLNTYDLGENLSVPRDFATLRQKHKDGMYQTLEQFKNDVYNLLKRALESNSPDSIPYQQAKYLLDQADLIFRSLRTNPIYAEKELEAWHQKYFQYKKKAVRFEKSTSIFSVEILESSSPTEQRRNTYKPEDNASHEIASMAFQPVELVYQSNSRSYEESMRNFVKDAGPVAKMVAQQKIQELAERNRAYQASNYQAFTNPDMSSQIPPFSNWSDNIQFGANPTSISLTTASNLPASSASLPQSNRYAAIFESSTSLGHGTNFEDFNSVQGLSCELHTDELLDLFTKIGTPEFLQSSISNTETSSGGASESVLGVNSQLLYGQGSQAIYPSYASS